MKRNAVYWVLVADSGQARVLELRKNPYQFKQVANLVSKAQHQPSRELVSDASGRAFHVQGPGGHSKLPRSDPHELAEEQFVRSLAGTLDKAARLGSFDHLVLMSDPKTRGRLRKYLGDETAGRVSEQMDIDVAGLPLNRLEPRIRSLLGWKRPSRTAAAISP